MGDTEVQLSLCLDLNPTMRIICTNSEYDEIRKRGDEGTARKFVAFSTGHMFRADTFLVARISKGHTVTMIMSLRY